MPCTLLLPCSSVVVGIGDTHTDEGKLDFQKGSMTESTLDGVRLLAAKQRRVRRGSSDR